MPKMQEKLPQTPANMLPVELILTILPLTRPSSSIPAATRLFASALGGIKSAKSPAVTATKNAWICSTIDLAPVDWDCWHFQGNDRSDINFCCLLAALQTSVDWYPVATCPGDSPAPPSRWKQTLCASLIMHRRFVDWTMFRCKRGIASDPMWSDFGRESDSDFDDEMSEYGSSYGSDSGTDPYLDPYLDLPNESPPPPWILDVVLLALFYMRANNLDLVSFTLVSLVHAYPSFVDFHLPLRTWGQLSLTLDDSEIALQVKWLADTLRNPSTSFPNFMLTLAALQWSAPLMSAICAALQVDPESFTEWPATRVHVFESMVRLLPLLPADVSPGPMCRWLNENGFEPNADHHTSIACWAKCAMHVRDLFLEHDQRYLHWLSRASSEYRGLCHAFAKFGLDKVAEEYGLK